MKNFDALKSFLKNSQYFELSQFFYHCIHKMMVDSAYYVKSTPPTAFIVSF